MAVTCDCRVELALHTTFGPFDSVIFDDGIFDVDTWVDAIGQGDILTVPLVCEYGIRGNSPNDRIASTGTLSFTLKNSATNSGGVVGYYSLLNVNKRAGFDLNLPVRFILSSPDVGSSTRYYKFRGVLDQAIPDPGTHGPRQTHCTAVDLWDDYARIDEPDVALQTNKRADEILTTMINALNKQPAARSFETGSESYTYSLDGGTGQTMKVRERINQLALSEFGYCYTKGDTTQGDTLTFEARGHRAANPTVLFRFDNDMLQEAGLTVPGARSDVFKTAKVFVHPTNDVASASTIVLWSLQNSTTLIAIGETNTTLFGAFFDPTTKEDIGGTSTIDPVATTDYTMNVLQDGTGADLTANFTVTASRTGLGVRWTITNGGASAGYITKLQVRGKPIYRYDAEIDVAVASGYGDQVIELDMAFQNNANVGKDVATAIAQRFSAPFAQVPWVRFWANKSVAFMTAALQREPGDRIAISETVTGLNAASHQFTINGCRYELQQNGQLFCTWFLEAASNATYWLLGTTNSSELGQTTGLGF